MEVTSPQLELFPEPAYQSQIERTISREFTPIASVSRGSPVEFVISPIEAHMPDLSRSALYVKVKITKEDGTALDANANVSVANMPLHSMWSAVEMRVGDTLVSDPNAMYPYRALLETFLSYTNEALETQKQTAGFFRDTPGKLDVKVIAGDAATNKGLIKRGVLFAQSAEAEFMDRIHADLFYPDILFPPGITIRVRLIPSSDAFIVIADGNAAYRFVVIEARLFVPFKVPTDAQLTALEMAMARIPARIQYRRVAMKHITIPAGVTTSTTDNIIMGRLPKRLVIAFVAEANMGGSIGTNPFEFKHFDIKYLALIVNGEMIPSKAYQPDFGKKIYKREYLGTLDAMDVTNRANGLSITLEEFAAHPIFVFDLSANQAANANTYDARRTGDVRLDLRFGTALPAATNVVILSEYLSEILIDKYRNVVGPL